MRGSEEKSEHGPGARILRCGSHYPIRCRWCRSLEAAMRECSGSDEILRGGNRRLAPRPVGDHLEVQELSTRSHKHETLADSESLVLVTLLVVRGHLGEQQLSVGKPTLVDISCRKAGLKSGPPDPWGAALVPGLPGPP